MEGSPWIKKCKANFDVTMGAYDGAGVAEFVGLYILSKLEKIIPQENIGLYRDDWLCVVRGEEGQPHHSLVRTTFSSFSRPNHIEILVLSILFFLSVLSLKINTFF